jgi:hypothetical protein
VAGTVTDDPGQQATPPEAPEDFEPRTIEVDVLFYKVEPDGTASGDSSPLRVNIRPAIVPGELRVGFFEEEVQGAGNQWKTAGWIAILFGAMAEGMNPTAYEFSFSTSGHIDGPSAGGLMTVAILAGLRNELIDPEATMTGTLNPDGSIGPVGGIPHKLEGAAGIGKKLVLIPVGQRQSFDENEQTYVDVIERGRELGLEVREVSTIFEAYELLTGHLLAQPQVENADTPLVLPEAAQERLAAGAEKWLGRYEIARHEVENRVMKAQEVVGPELAAIDELVHKARTALADGMPAVAYELAQQAALDLETLNRMSGVIESFYKKDVESAIEQVGSSDQLRADIEALVMRLRTEQPETVSDVVAFFTAYGHLELAEGMMTVADELMKLTLEKKDQLPKRELVTNLGSAALYYALAEGHLELSRDTLEIGSGFGQTPAPPAEQIFNIAEMMRRTAEANMAFFESTTIDELAQHTGQHPQVIQEFFRQRETDYLMAQATMVGMQILNEQIGEGPETAIPILGYSQSSYSFSSVLIAKYYSLSALLDGNLEVTGFRREEAIEVMLDFAEQRSRALLVQLGADAPIAAIMDYEKARFFRDGSSTEQLQALSFYWKATMIAQVTSFMIESHPIETEAIALKQ